MNKYDWIVIGGGITGSACAYELSKKKFKVLLIEKDSISNNATLYSYGGLGYWLAKTPLERQLAEEGIDLHRNLSQELDSDTEFRELDLILTVDKEYKVADVAQNYQDCYLKPELLDNIQAVELEPLLNKNAISGGIHFPHPHIHPQKTVTAYQTALLRNGGEIKYELVTKILSQKVETNHDTYHTNNTVVCAGGLTRSLLRESGIKLKTYFTHSQMITTDPVDIKLRTVIMPAVQERFALENIAENLEKQSSWDNPDNKIISSILDPSVVQFKDRSLCIGQISAILTQPEAKLDSTNAEVLIRQKIANLLPLIGNLPGKCNHCLVAFNNNAIAQIGHFKNSLKNYFFTGFTSTMLFAPPLAKHFANWVSGEKSEIIEKIKYIEK